MTTVPESVPRAVPTTGVPTAPSATVRPAAPGASAPAPAVPPPGDPESVPSPIAVTDPPATIPAAEDPFCRDYTTIVVSTYLFGLAEAFDPDPAAARRLEVVAAPALDAALRAATAGLPPDAAAESAAFSRRWSAYAARTAAALAALGSSGDSAELTAAWLAAITGQDLGDPAVAVPLPAPLTALVDAAAGTYAPLAGSIADDARVAESAAVPTPAVDAFASVHCPDVAVLAAGDAV